MPAYANFEDLKDYLTRRCANQNPPISFRELSLSLGKTHGYIHAIANGSFLPSSNAATAIADFFGDNPRIVRILVGLELPPTEEDRVMGEIKELAANLPLEGRRELLEYVGFLLKKYQDKAQKRAAAKN